MKRKSHRKLVNFEAKFGWPELIALVALVVAVLSYWESRATRLDAEKVRQVEEVAERRKHALHSYRLGYDLGAAQALLMWSKQFPQVEQFQKGADFSTRRTQSLIDQLGLELKLEAKDAPGLELETNIIQVKINDTYGKSAKDAYVLGQCIGRLMGGMTLAMASDEKARPYALKLIEDSYKPTIDEVNTILKDLQLNTILRQPEHLTLSFIDDLDAVDGSVISALTRS